MRKTPANPYWTKKTKEEIGRENLIKFRKYGFEHNKTNFAQYGRYAFPDDIYNQWWCWAATSEDLIVWCNFYQRNYRKIPNRYTKSFLIDRLFKADGFHKIINEAEWRFRNE